LAEDTATCINDVCDRVGTTAATPAHFTRAMVATWLSEAARTLAMEGPILKTCFQGTSQANVEIMSLPAPDFIKIVRIDLRRSNVQKRIRPMGHIKERPVDRTTQTSDTPSKYAVWAGNDASGNSVKGIVWDKNFGSTGTAPDLFIYLRQMPKTMVDGGQAPELTEVWMDACKDYAEMKARMRMAIMDPQQAVLAQLCAKSWELAKQRARDSAEPETEDEAAPVIDDMDYTVDDTDWNN